MIVQKTGVQVFVFVLSICQPYFTDTPPSTIFSEMLVFISFLKNHNVGSFWDLKIRVLRANHRITMEILT